jgi:hypothetical protein
MLAVFPAPGNWKQVTCHLFFEKNDIIIAFHIYFIKSISWKMNAKVFVLALLVLIGSSCKHKEEPINTPPPQETPQPTTPQPQAPHHHEHDHDDDDDDHYHHHGKKHHRLPPGHEKKLHGDQSARDYAPGHRKGH